MLVQDSFPGLCQDHTKRNEDLREADLYPKDPRFYENLHKNLIERFCEFYDKAAQDHFDTIEIKDMKPKRIKIADGYRRCSLLPFEGIALG
jgi:CRISPR-associated endoribonuclease Cas6